jgi:XTP/dITP diphosphohydrolase
MTSRDVSRHGWQERPDSWVIASHNAGKLREFAALLAPLGVRVLEQAELGVDEADEPYATFLENALTKARHASRIARLPALADDSGLCVDALRGEPGVRSARYAGLPKSDERNNSRLVHELQGNAMRQAHYYCVLVWLAHAEDPEPVVAEGRWDGVIVDTPRGTGGFGYDAHFYLPDWGCTAAQLTPQQKNNVSHRSQALAHLVARLRHRQVG